MFGHANIVDRVEDCGNGLGWSIIEWVDDSLYGNDYEFAVLRDGRPKKQMGGRTTDGNNRRYFLILLDFLT